MAFLQQFRKIANCENVELNYVILDFEKLAKLLALTTSTNDHEALAAVRKVNDFLKNANMTWTDLVEGKTSQSAAEMKIKYNQLNDNFNLLITKYNSLVSQLVIVQRSPQQVRRPHRRRF